MFTRKAMAQEAALEARNKVISPQFSSRDGSHKALTEVIKKLMHDPKSYEHVKTTYSDEGSYLIVTAIYRGRNAFGGLILTSTTAKVDLEGNILDIVEKGF